MQDAGVAMLKAPGHMGDTPVKATEPIMHIALTSLPGSHGNCGCKDCTQAYSQLQCTSGACRQRLGNGRQIKWNPKAAALPKGRANMAGMCSTIVQLTVLCALTHSNFQLRLVLSDCTPSRLCNAIFTSTIMKYPASRYTVQT